MLGIWTGVLPWNGTLWWLSKWCFVKRCFQFYLAPDEISHVVQMKENFLVKEGRKTKMLTYVSEKSKMGCNTTNSEKKQLFKYLQGCAALVVQILTCQGCTFLISGKFTEKLGTQSEHQIKVQECKIWNHLMVRKCTATTHLQALLSDDTPHLTDDVHMYLLYSIFCL